MGTLVQEKTNQAVEILNEKDIDLWITFAARNHCRWRPCLTVDLWPRPHLAVRPDHLEDRREDLRRWHL